MLKAPRHLLIVGLGLVSRLAMAGEHTQDSLDCSEGGIVHCRYWVPPGYDAAQRYPLVIYLHGAGQRGTDNISQVDPGWGNMFPSFWDPETRAQYPAFLMAPQCPSTAPDADPSWDPALDQWQWVMWDWSKGSYDVTRVAESRPLKEVLSLLASLQKKYSIDPDRIYVGGESMGGFGTWDLLARHPEIFAAGLPSDGGGSPQAAARLRGVPIWSVHNADDGAVPVSGDREMFAAVGAAGGRIWYTEGGEGGHGASGRIMNRALPWLFAQRRGAPVSSPLSLSFQPEGGTFASTQQVAVASSVPELSPVLRYTTNASVPTESSTPYSSPFALAASAIVMASSRIPGETASDYETTYHAAPFKIGSTPLPNGADVPPLGCASDCGGSGGSGGAALAGAGGAGAGASSGGGSGVAGAAAGGVGGSSAPATPGSAGAASNQSGSAGSSGAVSPTPSDTGCSLSGAPRSSRWFELWAALVAWVAVRRSRAPSQR